MKNKTLFQTLILLSLLTAVLLSSFSVSASSEPEITSLADGIIEFKLQSLSLDSSAELIDALAQDLDDAANPWYLIGLSRYLTEVDYSSALKSLNSYVNETERLSTTDRLKFSLLCSALTKGTETDFISSTVESAFESDLITNQIYLLLLLDSGNFRSRNHNREELIATILEAANEDGGWSLNGALSDTDLTAMAIQALAPYAETDEKVKTAIETALTLLSERQNPTGDFSSWGTQNPESVSQVICALCALGLDPLTDQRFTKNGVGLLDGLLRFKLEDGSFSHTLDGPSSDISSSQALYALIAIDLQSKGKPFLFCFDSNLSAETETAESSIPPASIESAPSKESESNQTAPQNRKPTDSPEDKNPKTGLKLVICAVIAAVFSSVGAFLFFKGKKKTVIPLLLAALLLCGAVFFIEIESVEEHYSSTYDSFSDGDSTVFLSIDASQALGLSPAVTGNGMILSQTELLLKEGETAYDLLCRASRIYKISFEHSGGSYIKGIGQLYEFDCGELSGWSFKVNGVIPGIPCCDFVLEDGDCLEWIYVLEPERNAFSK